MPPKFLGAVKSTDVNIDCTCNTIVSENKSMQDFSWEKFWGKLSTWKSEEELEEQYF
jgi:hypothetical protein